MKLWLTVKNVLYFQKASFSGSFALDLFILRKYFVSRLQISFLPQQISFITFRL